MGVSNMLTEQTTDWGIRDISARVLAKVLAKSSKIKSIPLCQYNLASN